MQKLLNVKIIIIIHFVLINPGGISVMTRCITPAALCAHKYVCASALWVHICLLNTEAPIEHVMLMLQSQFQCKNHRCLRIWLFYRFLLSFFRWLPAVDTCSIGRSSCPCLSSRLATVIATPYYSTLYHMPEKQCRSTCTNYKVLCECFHLQIQVHEIE